MIDKHKIALSIKRYREDNDYSQDELATKIGVEKRQIIRWEHAECIPRAIHRRAMKAQGIIQ